MDVNRSLIERFFKDACSDDEAERVKQYLEAHPQDATDYLIAQWEQAGEETAPVPGRKTMWRSLQQIIELRGAKRFTLSAMWWSAAAMLIVAMTVWAIDRTQQKPAGDRPVASISADRQPVRLLRFNTGTQPLTVTLPDSSEVVLQPGASIRYADSLATASTRQVELEGEGLFSVKKDPSRPFTVWAGPSATTALGTIFSVAPRLQGYCVRLLEGRVLVQLFDSINGSLKQQVILKPGQQADLDTLQNAAQVKQIQVVSGQPARQQSLKVNKTDLHFENAPLTEVLDKLGKYYGVTLHYEKEVINDKYFTGQVKANDSLPVLLQIIAQMNGLQVLPAGEGYQLTTSTIK